MDFNDIKVVQDEKDKSILHFTIPVPIPLDWVHIKYTLGEVSVQELNWYNYL